MNNATAVQTVQVTADTSTILNVFAASFTTPETVVSELLQNARRAGATRVEIDLIDDTLRISGDGCGITDFSVLLAMAKSGWSEEVRDLEGPYGIGFISALFAAREVRITSHGRQLHEHTATLRQLRPVDVVEVPSEPMTRIELIGLRSGVAGLDQKIRLMVQGFPLPILLNGQELSRPDATDGRFVDTPVGKLFNPNLSKARPRCYLMGLPIGVPDTGETSGVCPILHLDPATVRGRMPDRAQVLEPEAVAARVRDAVRNHAQDVIAAAQQSLSHEEWASTYFRKAMKWGLDDLIKACDVVPGAYLASYTGFPRVSRYFADDCNLESGTKPIHRSTLGKVLSIDRIECDDDYRGARVECLAQASGLPILNQHDLPSGHWMEQHLVTVQDKDITITTGPAIGQSTLNDAYLGTVKVLVHEWIEMHHPVIGTVRLPAEFGTVDAAGDLLVTPATSDDIVSLLSGFEDDDTYDEDAKSAAETAFNIALAEASGQAPLQLLTMVLCNALPNELPARLAGTRFKLSFGTEKNWRGDDRVTWSIEPE